MMSLHMGAATGLAAGKAMAEYLLEQQVSQETMRAAAYYGQTAGIEEAIAQGYGAAPQLRTDIDPALADALGLKSGQVITADHLAQILSGHRADGDDLPVQHQHKKVETYGNNELEDGKVRHRVAYLDLTLSAPKHLSIAWAFAETEAERNSLLQAHRTARDETLRYIEQQAIRGRLGAGGEGGYEAARAAWVTVDHFVARPTRETIRSDPETGEVYTELRSEKVAGDMAVHSHCLLPNLVRTASGRFVAIDATAFHGHIHHFGAVYQEILAREMTALGVGVDLDPATRMARLPAIEERAVDEFSKRSREGDKAARAYAEREGRDWDALSPEQQAAFRKAGTHATRLDKETNTPAFEAWRAQAERIGWEHTTVLGTAGPIKTRSERMDHADREGMVHLAEMLKNRAVIGAGDVRLAAARGFIAAGGSDTTDDIGILVRHWAKAGVLQDGQDTKLIWKETERGGIKITTELHRDQELELIDLARRAAADRRVALTPDEISKAVDRSGVSYSDRGGKSQRKAVETVGTDGGVSVVIGAAGTGKSTAILKPLVNAWQHRELDVWGTAQAWRQAKDLRKAGIDNANVRALDPFVDAVKEGQIKLGQNSVVVLDEVGRIGTRQLLDVLRLREQHGFKLAMLGDDKQCVAVEAGPVVDLLRRGLGPERVPEILDTIRQENEREQEIAGMWRKGEADKAIAAKREDGTAELVPGGYRDAVERVADLYAERRAATADRPNYSISISAPTNFDAHEIARLVRERRRAMGEVGPDQARVETTDGQGYANSLELAAGDRVRLFAQTRGVFTDDKGRRKSAVVGDNGTVLEVVAVDRGNGLSVRGESGKVAFVSWEALRDKGDRAREGGDRASRSEAKGSADASASVERSEAGERRGAGGSGRVKLAYGDVLTVDTAQGLTSNEHIGAMPAGSSAIMAGKAYVAGSRHITRHHLVASQGAELREVHSRRMSGLPQMTPAESTREAWENLTRNLSRIAEKESALALLEREAVTKRDTAKALQGALRRHEVREAEGLSATTVRETAAIRTLQEAMPAMAEGVAAVATQQTELVEQIAAVTPSEAPPAPVESAPQPDHVPARYRDIKISEHEAQDQFADALRAHGLRIKGPPVMDGKLHYVPVDGNRGAEKSGAYKGVYGDGRWPAGAIYNYKQGGFVGTWKAHGETVTLSAEEAADREAKAAARDAQHRQERIDREAAAAAEAAAMIAAAKPADPTHPYLVKKRVEAIGIYQDAQGRLLIPLRNAEGAIRNVQTIDADGGELFLPGAQKMGTFHMLGDMEPGKPVGIAEDYATSATVYRATGTPVADALDTSNLLAVANAIQACRSSCSRTTITICHYAIRHGRTLGRKKPRLPQRLLAQRS
jgi:conjugative relaxase-like TrwC/TraI family protein